MELKDNKARNEAFRVMAKKLVEKMTLEEKVSQTMHPAASI